MMISYYAFAAGLAILGASLSLLYKSRHLEITNKSSFPQRVQWVMYATLLTICLVTGLVFIVYSTIPGSNLEELALIVTLMPVIGFGASLVMLSLTEPQGTMRNTIRGLLILVMGVSVIMSTAFLGMRFF